VNETDPSGTVDGTFSGLYGSWPGVLAIQSFAVVMPLALWLPVVVVALAAALFSVLVTTFVTRRRPTVTVVVTDREVLLVRHARRGRPESEAHTVRLPAGSLRWKGPNRQAYFEVGDHTLWVPAAQRHEARRLAEL